MASSFSAIARPSFRRRCAPRAGPATASIAVTVAPDGRVTDAVGIEASDQAFIDAVLAVVPEWLFAPVADPADGAAPRGAALPLSLERRRQRVVAPRRRRGRVPGNGDTVAQIRTMRWSDMNPPPERLPPEVDDAPPPRIRGMAEINFIIDETGRVRVPAIVEASDWDAALVALDAVQDWRFAPPKHEGQPVLVEVRARWGD